MQRILIVLLLCAIILASSTIVFAEAENGPAKKLARGTKNILLGWTELPKSIVDTSRQSNVLVGLTAGTIKGIAQTFARTASGVTEVLTFPIGSYDRPAVKPSMLPEDTK